MLLARYFQRMELFCYNQKAFYRPTWPDPAFLRAYKWLPVAPCIMQTSWGNMGKGNAPFVCRQ